MIQQRDSPLGLGTLSVLLSVLLHGLLLWASSRGISPTPVHEEPPIKPVQWIDLQKSLPQQQIVDVTDKTSVTQENVTSKYLSDQNRRVTKNTVAQNQGPAPTPQAASPPTPSLNKESGLNLSDAKLQEILSKTQTPHTVAFNPSNYLPDIQVGDQTMLSTQKFAYATYFNRMKRAIAAYWRPPSHIVRHNPSKRSWITKMLIVLDETGDLREHMVIESSGASELDRYAVNAVAQAAPFYNPPEVLLDESGEIRMTWHFIFETRRF